jgi:mono/diheme cytochrome c family protein
MSRAAKRVIWWVAVSVALVASALVAQGQAGMRHGGMRHRGEQVSMVRHHYVRQHGLDAQYAGKRRPRAPTGEDLERGRALFEGHCASCHGARGAGDGEAGAGLSPPPANIAFATGRPMVTDGYLFWTLAEGGAPVGSAMPPFKDLLSEDEIWQLIAHLREL